MTTLESFRALTKLTAPISNDLRKYEKWWEQQPRDEFGKWTSGFSHGAFAASDQENDGPVDPPSNPKAGWENEPGWMGASAQHGISDDHPALDSATGAPHSGYLPVSAALKPPSNVQACVAGTEQVKQHFANGEIYAAKKLVHANPEILFGIAAEEYSSEKQAKIAAAFLNAATDGTWSQFGNYVKFEGGVPKENPLSAIAAQNNVTPQPKPVGAPKLVDLDAVEKPQPGTIAAANAVSDAHGIHVALETGDVASARKLALQNPQSLLALKAMEHSTSLEAKSAAAFLHLMTGKTFAQHGKKVKQVKGAVPSSLWSPPNFNGTGAPSYQPPAAPDAPAEPASIIPAPGEPLPQSEEAQAKAPEPTTAEAWENVEATPIAGKKVGGTNPGGFFELDDGTKGYAKFYSNVEQMQTEFMANQVYKKLGINAPDSRLVTINGKKAIFSPLIENGKQNTGGVTSDSTFNLAAHPQIMSGFAADAILANHDVVGLTHDNIMFTPDGQAHRLDNGGALKYRAQGALKSNYSKDAVPELDTMRDAKFGAGKIFQGLSDQTVADQAVHVAQTVKPEDVAKIVADAGFTGKDAVEHADMINGRIKAALKWAIPKLKTPEQQANAMALASSITPAEPEKTGIPAPPVGDALLAGVNQDPHIANVAKLALAASPSYASSIPDSVYVAIGTNDEHAFAKAATSSAATLVALAQKKWTNAWPAIKMASILTHLTGQPYKAAATAGGIKVVKGNYGTVVAQPDPNAQVPKAEDNPYIEKPIKTAAPLTPKAKAAAAKANLDYSVFTPQAVHHSWVTQQVSKLAKIAQDQGVFSNHLQQYANLVAAQAVKNPQIAAAFNGASIPASAQEALHGAFKDAGIDSTVAPSEDSSLGDGDMGTLSLHGVHSKHVAQALALTPGIHQSTAPEGPNNDHLGPLFLNGDFKPIGAYGQRDVKRMITKIGKFGPKGGMLYLQAFEKDPDYLHYLAVTPLSKASAERVAAAWKHFGKSYSAKPVKLPGVPQYVMHFSTREANDGSGTGGQFDKAFMEKHGGANPLTSKTPLALMLKNKHLLPEGVTPKDLVRTNTDTDSHESQDQAVKRIAAINPESAAFLQAHYANINAEPAHPQANIQGLFLGAVDKLPSPFLRPHEVMNRVLNHHRVLPEGMTPAMLHAETPEEQAAAIQEAKDNAGYMGNADSAKWLHDYYAQRKEAANPQHNRFVPAGTITPPAIPSNAHPDFLRPDALGPETPHTSELPYHVNSATTAVSVSPDKGRTSAHPNALTPQRESITGSDGRVHDLTHLDVPPGSTTVKAIGQAAFKKAADVIEPLIKAHQEALDKGDPEAHADPHGSLPPGGVAFASQHAYRMSQNLYKPMLEAARAAMPSEQVIRDMQKSNKVGYENDGKVKGKAGGVTRAIFNAIAQKLGISPTDEQEVDSTLSTWAASTQNDTCFKMRVASNMLRGRPPWENVKPGKTGMEAITHANKLSQEITPGFLKALLLHKAITHASFERTVDENGTIPFARGIQEDAASSMMGKTAAHALAEGRKGEKIKATEMTLAGYAPYAIGFDSGAQLHRLVRPEEIWHGVNSPTNSLYAGEMEHVIQDNGDTEYTLAPRSEIHAKGQFVTPGGDHTPTAAYKEHWRKMIKAMQAASDVIKPLAGDDEPLLVPMTREGWHQWVPPTWTPSKEHIAAFRSAMTDPDGVMRLDFSRDHGWATQNADPETRRRAAQGELAAS